MIGRLPIELLGRLMFQALLIFAIVLGPIANVGALASLDGACGVSCPCDAESQSAVDPCADEHTAQSEAVPASDTAESCTDDCSDCDCNAGITCAVNQSPSDYSLARLPNDRAPGIESAGGQAAIDRIFIPPRPTTR